MANIQIKERRIVELHPHPKNEGIYGDEDIEQLAQDIERSKWVKPLIVTPEGTIISGHRRWKAVSYLGWVTVPIEEKEFTDEIAELEARVEKVKKELSRPSFQALKMNKKCNWIVLEYLAQEWEAIIKYGTELDAINRLSENLNILKK
ncbi:MAG: ParB N-terminal domain-containing protein [Nostoc sp.]|uniref:ParB N-terminal domain-containing protein n=1 Tax=Nostoc sp. TaxID=1180 RepID=UPI002FF5CBB3